MPSKMSSSALSNFPVLSGLLREFVDYDIAKGLADTLKQIGQGWKTPYSEVQRVQKRTVKKLRPEQKVAMRNIVKKTVVGAIDDPKPAVPDIDISGVISRINSREEAAALVSSLQAVAIGLQEIDQMFVNNCVAEGYISREDADTFIQHAQQWNEIPLGPKTLQFIREHRDKFLVLLDLDENLEMNVDRAASLLRSAIDQTPEEGEKGRTRKDAVLGTHYLLHHIAVSVHHTADMVSQELKSRNLPKEPPENPLKPDVSGVKRNPAPAEEPAEEPEVRDAGAKMAAQPNKAERAATGNDRIAQHMANYRQTGKKVKAADILRPKV